MTSAPRGPGTGGADVALFGRSQWRAAWRRLTLLTAVTALVTTAVLTAATGARHSPGAFERLRAATDAADLHVSLSSLPTTQTLQLLEQLDGVTATVAQPMLWITPAGSDLYPGYHLFSVADDWQSTQVNRPLAVDGRLPGPAIPTEIAMSRELAEMLDARVGDTIALEAMTEQQLEAESTGQLTDGPPAPPIDATLVGVVKSPIEFGQFRFVMYLSPSLVGPAAVLGGAEVRLADPSLAGDPSFIAALHARVAALDDGTGPFGQFERPTTVSLFGPSVQSDGALDTIARALWIVGTISIAAGAIAIAQLSVRSGRSMMRERATLVALGWTRRRQTMAVLLTIAPWLGAGVVLAIPAAVLMSPLAVVGLAAQVDPAPDARVVDVAVLGFGGVAMLAVVLGLGSAAATVATRPAARRSPGSRGPIHLGQPLVARLGLRHALDGATGSGGRTSRTAVALAGMAVVGVIAAFSVSASIDRLQTDPTLLGNPDTRTVGGEGLDELRKNVAILQSDPRVGEIEHDSFWIGPTPVGHPDDPLVIIAFDVIQGQVDLRVPEGRRPAQSDEISLGPALLERFGLHVGDDIVLAAGDVDARYRIVGSALGAEGEVHFDEYVAMTFAGSDRLLGSTGDNPEIEHEINFGYVPGTDEAAADADLRSVGLEIFVSEAAVLPPSVANLGQVADIPLWIAAYLGILGLSALGHGLVVGVGSQRREFVILRALGLRRRGAVAIIAIQVLAMAGLAAVAGLPIGMLVSRRLWHLLATDAHVVVETVLPWGSIATTGIAALFVTSMMGLLAATSAIHANPNPVLRTE